MDSDLEKKLAAFKKRLERLCHKCVFVDVQGAVSFLSMFENFQTWDEWNNIIFSSEDEEKYFQLDTNNIGDITMDIDDTWIDMKNGLSLMIYKG